MPTIDDFKIAPIFADLGDDVLEKLASVSSDVSFEEDEAVFERDADAAALFIIKEGKVLNESDLSADISVTLDSLKPGYVFGWRAVLPGEVYGLRAVAAQHTECVKIDAKALRELMETDHTFGFSLMRRLFWVVQMRYLNRTDQFTRMLRRHPDLHIVEEGEQGLEG